MISSLECAGECPAGSENPQNQKPAGPSVRRAAQRIPALRIPRTPQPGSDNSPFAENLDSRNRFVCLRTFVSALLQYFGTEGSTSSDQARIPPFKFQIFRKPALRKNSTPSPERFPLRQCATISPEPSASCTRRGCSPSRIKYPRRLHIWYSFGSRTSRSH